MILDANPENFVNSGLVPHIPGMMEKHQIIGVVTHLKEVLDQDIPGAVVELGCHLGTTSLFIRRYLDLYGSKKEFHVYDSWQGLPDKHYKDQNSIERQFLKGECQVTRDDFVRTFLNLKLRLPIIHNGWFADIPDEQYPDQICFAFFDGDFYTSIMDSFAKTYHKIQSGGIIVIDDCGWEVLPGVERACFDFLYDKPEALEYTGYLNHPHGGKVVKL